MSSNASEEGTILDTRKDETVDTELDRLISRRASTDHGTTADEFEPAYETIWDALPELRASQDAGGPTYCPECGRQLTFEGGRASADGPM